MNNVTPEKKQALMKALAVAGVIAIIILLAWLSIQLISYAPRAFTSLASLADSVYDRSPGQDANFTVSTDQTITTSGEPVTLAWDAPDTPGSFVFSYTCTEGVAIDIVSSEQELRSISCDTNYNVGNVTELTLNIESEKNRFIDVPYTVAFLRTNDIEPSAQSSGLVAVTNPQLAALSEDEEADAPAPADDPEENGADESASDTTDSATTPSVTTNDPDALADQPAHTSGFTQEFVYEIPVSDPNGEPDLAVRLIGVGELRQGRNFFESGILTSGEQGAVQFEVKNLGTRTSEVWSYQVSLPGDISHTADDQAPLSPNERAVITVGFPVSKNTDVADLSVSIESPDDRTTINDTTRRIFAVE